MRSFNFEFLSAATFQRNTSEKRKNNISLDLQAEYFVFIPFLVNLKPLANTSTPDLIVYHGKQILPNVVFFAGSQVLTKENTHIMYCKRENVRWQGTGSRSAILLKFATKTEFNVPKEMSFICFDIIISEKSSQISPPILKHSQKDRIGNGM